MTLSEKVLMILAVGVIAARLVYGLWTLRETMRRHDD